MANSDQALEKYYKGVAEETEAKGRAHAMVSTGEGVKTALEKGYNNCDNVAKEIFRPQVKFEYAAERYVFKDGELKEYERERASYKE